MKRPPISKYHSLKMFLKQSRKSVKQVGFNSIGNPGYRLFYRPCQFSWLASETFLFETGRHWSNAGMFVLHSPLTKPVLRLIKAYNVALIVVISQNNIGTGPIE